MLLKALKASKELHHLNGEGVRLGVVDTGIGLLHKAFKSQNGHERIVFEKDLVGSDYNPESKDFSRRLPQAGAYAFDERGHGTHVAGIMAGSSFEGYEGGLAPQAKIVPLKVFGRSGGTSTAVLLKALEYLLDPNEDLNPEDHVDIINLSIGRAFGRPYSLYEQVIKRLSRYGILTVVSAGNSGNIPLLLAVQVFLKRL